MVGVSRLLFWITLRRLLVTMQPFSGVEFSREFWQAEEVEGVSKWTALYISELDASPHLFHSSIVFFKTSTEKSSSHLITESSSITLKTSISASFENGPSPVPITTG